MNDTQSTELTREQQHAAELIDGLRALADMFDAYPDLAARTRYSPVNMLVPVDDKHEVAAFIRAAKAHAAAIEKSASDSSKYFSALCKFGPVTLDVYLPREQVCERIVTGTETKMVPDPVALAAVPQVEQTVEKVEWKCRPLLAEDEPAAVQ